MDADQFMNLISVEEAAYYAHLSKRHMRFLLETKKVIGKKVGRNWITTYEEVDKYLNTNPKPGRKTIE